MLVGGRQAHEPDGAQASCSSLSTLTSGNSAARRVCTQAPRAPGPGRSAGIRPGAGARRRARRAPGCRAAPPRRRPPARSGVRGSGRTGTASRAASAPSSSRAGTGPSATTAAAPVAASCPANSATACAAQERRHRARSTAARRGAACTWDGKPRDRVPGVTRRRAAPRRGARRHRPTTSTTATGRSWVVRHSLVAWPNAGSAAASATHAASTCACPGPIIAVMRLSPLSPRVVVLSWGMALIAWPLAWLLLAVAQGLGTVVAGGGWIGFAVPLGAPPLGAGERAEHRVRGHARRAPPLLAGTAARRAGGRRPGCRRWCRSRRSWLSEVGVFQLAVACAVLGLGWAPPLGVADGPAAGWRASGACSSPVFLAVSTVVGAVVVQLAVTRLASHLWVEPGGPRRTRRLLVAARPRLRAGRAGGAWRSSAWGGRSHRSPCSTAARCWSAPLLGAWLWVPRSPLHPRPHLRWRAVVGVAVVGAVVFVAAFVGGGAAAGPRHRASCGGSRGDEQRAPRDGGGPAHAAPRPEKTAGTVSSRILRSSHSDQLSM